MHTSSRPHTPTVFGGTEAKEIAGPDPWCVSNQLLSVFLAHHSEAARAAGDGFPTVPGGRQRALRRIILCGFPLLCAQGDLSAA